MIAGAFRDFSGRGLAMWTTEKQVGRGPDGVPNYVGARQRRARAPPLLWKPVACPQFPQHANPPRSTVQGLV